jgi:ABC-type Fe3+-citrate transport system substrate-binding protein
MVRFGAEMVFSSKDSTITDEDIDRIIAKGEETTAELDAKMKKFTEDAIKFKMDDSTDFSLSLSLSLSLNVSENNFFSPQLLNYMILMMIR